MMDLGSQELESAVESLDNALAVLEEIALSRYLESYWMDVAGVPPD